MKSIRNSMQVNTQDFFPDIILKNVKDNGLLKERSNNVLWDLRVK